MFESGILDWPGGSEVRDQCARAEHGGADGDSGGRGTKLVAALELPGKLRLQRGKCFAVQKIYYPGFTAGVGIGEGGGLIATLILLLLVRADKLAFWLVLMALAGLGGMHVVFWVFTQPVNRVWPCGREMGRFSSTFLGVTKGSAGTEKRPVDWICLRDRWEYLQVASAGLALLSFLAVVVAVIARGP